jgi:hypothetical protein
MPMDKPDPELKKRLDACILPANTPSDFSERGSHMDGKSVGGRPRGASEKHAFNLKRVKGVKSQFDSFYT